MRRTTVLTVLIPLLLSVGARGIEPQDKEEVIPFTRESVGEAERLIGLEFTEVERDSMLEDLNENLGRYRSIRNLSITNSVPPAIQFNPVPIGKTFDTVRRAMVTRSPGELSVPENLEDLAFYSVVQLSELVRTRRITSTELTRMYIARLKRHGPQLESVVTLTEELALAQARVADEEIASGRYRGPLHGIPYGAKDLLAVRGYKTTWGAAPTRDQVIDEDATVIRKLEEAGAVLVAKLTLGALAWGDVWYGGRTRNPWNLEEGSRGSSAGSAATTSAGLVAFAIGTETWGSIVSPSTRCGVSGLRPTFGRVSRTGAMALSWSMDKIGPICRTVEDCALVFQAILGPDGLDQSVVDLPFNYDPEVDLSQLRIGYLARAFDEDYPTRENDRKVLAVLRDLGADLIPVSLPDYPVSDLSFILTAEAAAAFDDLTRSGRDDLLVRQIKNAWPNVFRVSRFIPAVEYIQANRTRYLLLQEMETLMRTVDIYVAPSFGGGNLLLTNLTGHPCVVVPNGFNENGSPTSISFIGGLYDEATVLAVARLYQEATDWHRQYPPLFKEG